MSLELHSLYPSDVSREETLLAVTLASMIANKYSGLVKRGRLKQKESGQCCRY
jgi:hypothetical protein